MRQPLAELAATSMRGTPVVDFLARFVACVSTGCLTALLVTVARDVLTALMR